MRRVQIHEETNLYTTTYFSTHATLYGMFAARSLFLRTYMCFGQSRPMVRFSINANKENCVELRILPNLSTTPSQPKKLKKCNFSVCLKIVSLILPPMCGCCVNRAILELFFFKAGWKAFTKYSTAFENKTSYYHTTKISTV